MHKVAATTTSVHPTDYRHVSLSLGLYSLPKGSSPQNPARKEDNREQGNPELLSSLRYCHHAGVSIQHTDPRVKLVVDAIRFAPSRRDVVQNLIPQIVRMLAVRGLLIAHAELCWPPMVRPSSRQKQRSTWAALEHFR